MSALQKKISPDPSQEYAWRSRLWSIFLAGRSRAVRMFHLFLSAPRSTDAKLLFGLGTLLAVVGIASTMVFGSMRSLQQNFDTLTSMTAYIHTLHDVRRDIDRLDLYRDNVPTSVRNNPGMIDALRARLNSNLRHVGMQARTLRSRERTISYPKGVSRVDFTFLLDTLKTSNEFETNGQVIEAQVDSAASRLIRLKESIPTAQEQASLELEQAVFESRKLQSQLMQHGTAFLASVSLLMMLLYWLIQHRAAIISPVAPRIANTTPNTAEDTREVIPDNHSIAEAARIAERASIARDIHDDLGALLLAIKFDLKRWSKLATHTRRAVDSEWRTMLDRVDAAMNTVTRIAGQLKPYLIERVGLWNAIESYANEFQGVVDIPCYLHFDIRHRSLLHNENASDIFRIFQESLTNVARHAEASMVEIAVLEVENCLTIEVTDNGKGIQHDHILNPGSLGVAGMIERAKRLGGELKISQRLTGGTRVFFQMPFPAAV